MNTKDMTYNITVPSAPALKGLVFRRFAGNLDFHKMADIINACNVVDLLDRHESAEDIESAYKHLRNSDPYHDMLFADVDDQTIAYTRVGWRIEGQGNYIYEHIGFVIPEWRHKGIGGAMLRYNQNRLREIAASQTDNEMRFYESYAVDTEYPTARLLKREGYEQVRHFFIMVRPNLENIPDAFLPKGLELRPVEPEQYQEICDASAEAFQDHWGYSADQEPTVAEWRDDPNFDPSLWKVAWDGNQVVGMVLSYIKPNENRKFNRKRGYPDHICVRRPWRKQGVARALLADALHEIKRRGMEEAALGVDTDNPTGALGLYKSVGFEPVKQSTLYRKQF